MRPGCSRTSMPAAPAWSRWMCERRRCRRSPTSTPRAARAARRRGGSSSGSRTGEPVVGLDEVRRDPPRVAAVHQVERLVRHGETVLVVTVPASAPGSSVGGAMTFARPGGHRCDVGIDKEVAMPAPTLVIGAPCWIDLFSSDTEKASSTAALRLEGRAARRGLRGYFVFTKDGKVVAGCMANDGEQGTGQLDDVPHHGRRSAHRGRGRREGRPGASRADGRRRQRDDGDGRRPGPGRDRCLAARHAEGLRDPERGRRRSVVRAAHARVRRIRRLLPRRVRLGHARCPTRPSSGTPRSARARASSRGSWTRPRTPEGTPGFWTIYFEVPDTDAALERSSSSEGR